MKPAQKHIGLWFRTSPHSSGPCVFLGVESDGGVAMAYRLKTGLGQPFKVPPGRFHADGWYQVKKPRGVK
jgi:hypothetical protein